MKTSRLLLLSVLCAPLLASAQWQWVDNAGRRVFSDQPPPGDIAPERILKRPGQRGPAFAPPQAAAPVATATLPKPSGKDPALERKLKEAEAAEKAKQKAEDEKVAALRADNCTRAKASKATFDSGMRIARTNAKGEREILDESQRAAETKHLEEVIRRDCSSTQ